MVYLVGPSAGVETEIQQARMLDMPIFEWRGKATIAQITNLDLFTNQEKLI
jgi:hypothetical protein